MGETPIKVIVPDNLFSSANVDDERRSLRYLVRQEALFRLAIRGYTAKSAAEQIGCSPSFAQAVFSKPEFKRRVLQAQDYAHRSTDVQWLEDKKTLGEQIKEKGQLAFDTLINLLESDDTAESVKVKIATDLLDRNNETAATAKQERVIKIDSDALQSAISASATMDHFIKEKPENLKIMPRKVG